MGLKDLKNFPVTIFTSLSTIKTLSRMTSPYVFKKISTVLADAPTDLKVSTGFSTRWTNISLTSLLLETVVAKPMTLRVIILKLVSKSEITDADRTLLERRKNYHQKLCQWEKVRKQCNENSQTKLDSKLILVLNKIYRHQKTKFSF